MSLLFKNTRCLNKITEEARLIFNANKDFYQIFKKKDKEVKVDSKIVIEPKPDKPPAQKEQDILELYKIFVGEDKPDPQNEKEIKRWTIRKRAMQKMILEEFGKEEFIDLILGTEEETRPEKKKEPKTPETPQLAKISPETAPGTPVAGPGQAPPGPLRALMQKIPLINRIV